MADDWKPGDLALCVRVGCILCPDCGGIHTGEANPPKGSLREVARVGFCSEEDTADEAEAWGSCFSPTLDFTDGTGGHATRFRKVTPDAADEFDRETIALMNGQPETVQP